MISMKNIRFSNTYKNDIIKISKNQEGDDMGLYKNRIVVKVGTSTLINERGKIDLKTVEHIVRVLSDIHNMGYDIILVSSGAIAFGCNKLNLKSSPKNVREKQAIAAVGQCGLVHLYEKLFGEYGQTIAQILLSSEDTEQQEKKDNLVNTFDILINMGVIPIVNENDSISNEEIESRDLLFGDNDMLSSVVAVICNANKLINLSDVDGLYDKDPIIFPEAKPIEKIGRIDDNIIKKVLAVKGSRRGSNGVKSKFQAAKYAMKNGIDTVVISGKNPELLYKLINDESAGTLFTAKTT